MDLITENDVTHSNSDALGLISSAPFAPLIKEYQTHQAKGAMDMGFNFFSIVSDLYYRENFHSDILRAFLDPKGPHNEGDMFLRSFIEFLNYHGADLTVADFLNSTVIREGGRVDIKILNKDRKSAIIIENKINGAGDMNKQLPRYLEHLTASGYNCNAIVYLRLSSHSYPDTTGWTDAERIEIKRLLCVVCAFDESHSDLVTAWIEPCIKFSVNDDARVILNQYGRLLKKLGGNVMNRPVMEDFYLAMREGDNFRKACSFQLMLKDLSIYRLEMIKRKFLQNINPFNRISRYQDTNVCFTDLFWEEAHFGIDVIVRPEDYVFHFWDRNDRTGEMARARDALVKMHILENYTDEGAGFSKTFLFPREEDLLIDHINLFKERLAEVLVITPK